jgi:hypothetical protein|tara:strand:+ start:944 stop:1210 length:267 start_codon:yes stop_codon:yes gene_type:complete
MKEETKYLIEEAKQNARIDEIMKERVVKFDGFFKYSGKTEEQTKRFWQGQTEYSGFFDKPEDYTPLPTPKQLQIHNDMTKYKLKKKKK